MLRTVTGDLPTFPLMEERVGAREQPGLLAAAQTANFRCNFLSRRGAAAAAVMRRQTERGLNSCPLALTCAHISRENEGLG